MFRTLWGIRYILPLQKMPAIFKLPPEGSDPIRAQMKRNYDEYQIKRCHRQYTNTLSLWICT